MVAGGVNIFNINIRVVNNVTSLRKPTWWMTLTGRYENSEAVKLKFSVRESIFFRSNRTHAQSQKDYIRQQEKPEEQGVYSIGEMYSISCIATYRCGAVLGAKALFGFGLLLDNRPTNVFGYRLFSQ